MSFSLSSLPNPTIRLTLPRGSRPAEGDHLEDASTLLVAGGAKKPAHVLQFNSPADADKWEAAVRDTRAGIAFEYDKNPPSLQSLYDEVWGADSKNYAPFEPTKGSAGPSAPYDPNNPFGF